MNIPEGAQTLAKQCSPTLNIEGRNTNMGQWARPAVCGITLGKGSPAP